MSSTSELLAKPGTCCGACTATSGSSGNIVGNGGSSDEASVAADCLSWLKGADFDCCEAAVWSGNIEVLAGAANAILLKCKLAAERTADKAAARAVPTYHAQLYAMARELKV